MPEPRDPLLKVLIHLFCLAADSEDTHDTKEFGGLRRPPESGPRAALGRPDAGASPPKQHLGMFT